jgi:hypothetical protein
MKKTTLKFLGVFSHQHNHIFEIMICVSSANNFRGLGLIYLKL